ncbi:uncharacterized protein LOC127841248 [Dreissena polymorpha]|uniref:Uncharacterized protein n=1 Tax=Dreissena polymorpha TaxID=45954 RepID=A0A9D4F505_DREPO|nr:uncharacterized protein LOC127841248 [Dreissena polymorpha]KAH3789512.1 hypothetical protein DPMN_167693 [Dreissena polymorpha]
MTIKGQTLELIARCTNCYGDSPKAFKLAVTQPMAKCTSEYQAAYKYTTWQPPPQSLKPENEKVKNYKKRTAYMERKTTYGLDFVNTSPTKKHAHRKSKATANSDGDQRCPVHECTCAVATEPTRPTAGIRPRRPKSPPIENSMVIHPDMDQRFVDDTIYGDSYPAYSQAVMQTCRQQPIKAKDNIEVPAVSERRPYGKSTAQTDFVPHENVERPELVRPHENSVRATGPMEGRTEYTDYFTSKAKDEQLCKNKDTMHEEPKFDAISTAMADFITPKNVERPRACYPPVSGHFVPQEPAKFDGETTSSAAYKQWPVQRYELPIWAQKPRYKRPEGGILVTSLYMHDYKNPKVIQPPRKIRPHNNSRNDIMHLDEAAEAGYSPQTTYSQDFRVWTGSHWRESYRTIDMYQPPKEKMVFETNHRSQFTGERVEKLKPCRHISEHRKLNTDKKMLFSTTYTDNYKHQRPKSTPSAAVSGTSVSGKVRSLSAHPVVKISPSTVPLVSAGKIPIPDLTVPETQAPAKNNSAQDSITSPKIANILNLEKGDATMTPA